MTPEQIERLREWHKAIFPKIKAMEIDRYDKMNAIESEFDAIKTELGLPQLEFGRVYWMPDYWSIYLNGELISEVKE